MGLLTNAIPNNQRIIKFNTPKQSIYFIRIAARNGQSVILTDAGFMIYVPIALAGYLMKLTEIISYANMLLYW